MTIKEHLSKLQNWSCTTKYSLESYLVLDLTPLQGIEWTYSKLCQQDTLDSDLTIKTNQWSVAKLKIWTAMYIVSDSSDHSSNHLLSLAWYKVRWSTVRIEPTSNTVTQVHYYTTWNNQWPGWLKLICRPLEIKHYQRYFNTSELRIISINKHEKIKKVNIWLMSFWRKLEENFLQY